LQNYFLKKREMPSGVVAKIAVVLDVSADWIISGQGARLAEKTVADCLNMIEQVRGLSGHKVSFEECAQMFANFYDRFYQDRFGPGAVDPTRLDRMIEVATRASTPAASSAESGLPSARRRPLPKVKLRQKGAQ
jgi:hypothetical protein